MRETNKIQAAPNSYCIFEILNQVNEKKNRKRIHRRLKK